MKIPLSSPDITENEKQAVLSVLNSRHLALGPVLSDFENEFASYIGAKHAIAVNSGTSGLHLAIRALNIGEGDEVITSPFSFIASANCALYERAKPVFVDIDPGSLNLNPDKIEAAITERTKAIVAVDIFGHPAEKTKIKEIAQKHNLRVIEDSCEAIGATYSGQKCGTFGEIGVFAFYPNKQITTGEGGMIVTDNEETANYCRAMMNQGREVCDGRWLSHKYLGYNYRMSDISAAVGLAQVRRLDEILEKRRRVAELYNEKLKTIEQINIPYQAPNCQISWFVYVIQLNFRYSEQDRDNIMSKLQNAGIACSNYFQCIHLQPYYRESFGYREGMFSVAENVSKRTIALPFFSNLTETEIDYIVNTLKQCLS